MIQLTPSDLRSTIGAGMTLTAAAKMLRTQRRCVRHWLQVYGLEIHPLCPTSKQHGGYRRARITTAGEWQALVDAYGPGLRKLARAVDMDPKWVSEQLRKHRIDPGEGQPGRPWPSRVAA